MIRNRRQQALVTLIAVGVLLVAGASCGYELGRTLTLRIAQEKLIQKAASTLAQEEISSRETRAMLASINVSHFRSCSNAEIGWFRNLIFQSQFLKDAGRIRGGRIACSATLGRLERPVELPDPDFAQTDGTSVYKRFAPFRVGELPVVAVQLEDAYVVVNPFMDAGRDMGMMHLTTRSIGDPDWHKGGFGGSSTLEARELLTRDGHGRFGAHLFATRCSPLYFNCVTESISIEDALGSDRRQSRVFLSLGAAIGAVLGFVCSLFYRRNRSLANQLHRAIAADELEIVYQPIMELENWRLAGVEALSRWTDDEGFAVSPDVFVRVAEERGFVGQLTRLVVRRALADLAGVVAARPDFRISINVSAMDFSDPEFLPMLDRAFAESAVPRRNVAFELTETGTLRRDAVIDTIRRLHQEGHQIHIDDFGVGYSSLSYLKDLSADALKIDRSFTQSIGTDSIGVAIIPQILAIAEALHMRVIVEGIETVQQAAYFSSANQPLFGQGWFIGKPTSAAGIEEMLAAKRSQAQCEPIALAHQPACEEQPAGAAVS
jgi:sensor c-di-GMP phosphodiesterase-like protein